MPSDGPVTADHSAASAGAYRAVGSGPDDGLGRGDGADLVESVNDRGPRARSGVRPFLHPLAAARLSGLVRTVVDHGGVSPRYAAQLGIMAVGCLLRWPMCAVEAARVARRVAEVRFDPPPVFIVGHWRSGTTYLHHLMSLDPAFCFPTLLDVYRPYDFLPSPLAVISEKILLRSLPERRPMDSVPLRPGLPQEEEAALAAMGAPSFFNCLYFPRRMSAVFEREVLLADDETPATQRWRDCLRYFLAKLLVAHPGHRLLLKNPANSGRVRPLRAMFPGAKFVHIHRNPLAVFASTRKLYHRLLPLLALQPYRMDAVDAHILWAYPTLMDRLLDDLASLPEGDVIEIAYDELLRDPASVLARIYGTLGLGEVDLAKRSMSRFAAMGPAVPTAGPDSREAGLRRAAQAWRRQAERLGYLLQVG
jgi:omega-hydroxy-beta-dihydromenaquinone-9 sulfotransferase